MPLVLITFSRFSSEDEIPRYNEFQRVRKSAFEDASYGSIFHGTGWLTIEGNRTQKWHRLSVEAFEQTSDYVNAATHPSYSGVEAWFEESELIEYGQFVGHVPLTRAFRRPVVLLLANPADEHQNLLIETIHSTLEPFSGEIRFATPIEKIDGNTDIDVSYFAFIEFDSMTAMMNFMVNTIRKSQFARLRKHMDNVSLIIATPS